MYRAEFQKGAFRERYKVSISGMTDFAHLNDYISKANFKLGEKSN